MQHHKLASTLALTLLGILCSGRTFAVCPTIPDAGCNNAFISGFSYNDSGDDTKDKLSFKLVKGEYSPPGDFGDPTLTTSYELCLYQDGALTHTLAVAAGGTCTGVNCWGPKSKGFGFRDKLGAQSGVVAIKLSTPGEVVNKTAVSLKGAGIELADLPLPLIEPIAVQLRSSVGGCWGGIYRGEGQVGQKPERGKMKTRFNVKVLPTCSDGVANGYEMGVDCGRGCSLGCADGSPCLAAADCSSGTCDAGTCVTN